VAGSAGTDDEVVLLPQGRTGRIRAIQVYGRDSTAVVAGQCAALNMRHWDHNEIRRGNVIAAPGYFEPCDWCVCQLDLLPNDRCFVKNGEKIRFHTGTSETLATAYLLEGQGAEPGQQCLIQIRLDHPIVVGPGDRFIVRSLSPMQTIGGGTIIEPTARRLKRNRPGLIQDLRTRADAVPDAKSFIEYCIRAAEGGVARPAELSQRVKLPPDRVTRFLTMLTDDGAVIALNGGLLIHRSTLEDRTQQIVETLTAYHEESPVSPGMLPDDLGDACSLGKHVVEAIVAQLVTQGKLIETNHRLALPDHCQQFSDEDRQLLETVETIFRRQLFRPPNVDELDGLTGASRANRDRIIGILCEHERLVEVASGLLFHQDAIQQARDRVVAHIRAEGRLESVQFKYLLDTTRKFAIPLLDYFDRIGVTRRVGNTRYLRESSNEN
jgi:selenocysteine-specific elongation factor